jgi:hypothetical protein
MAPPFPLFVKGLIEIFSPKLQSFPLWFIFYTTFKIIGSKNFKEIVFSSQDRIGMEKDFLAGLTLCVPMQD